MSVRTLEYLLRNVYGEKIINVETVAEEPVKTLLVQTKIKKMTLIELTTLNNYLIRFNYMIDRIRVSENCYLDLLIVYGEKISQIATSETVTEVAKLASAEGIEKEREKEKEEKEEKGFGDFIFDMIGKII
jgi:hypothetical protein